ncbi:MAG: hypothetical protein M3270_05055 [Thermoproteota archaeon]|nr:hypothetical protein [Thermoproteota archaeon]
MFAFPTGNRIILSLDPFAISAVYWIAFLSLPIRVIMQIRFQEARKYGIAAKLSPFGVIKYVRDS